MSRIRKWVLACVVLGLSALPALADPNIPDLCDADPGGYVTLLWTALIAIVSAVLGVAAAIFLVRVGWNFVRRFVGGR